MSPNKKAIFTALLITAIYFTLSVMYMQLGFWGTSEILDTILLLPALATLSVFTNTGRGVVGTLAAALPFVIIFGLIYWPLYVRVKNRKI